MQAQSDPRTVCEVLAKPSTRLDRILRAAADCVGIPTNELRMLADDGRRLDPCDSVSECGLEKWSEISLMKQLGGGPAPDRYATLTATGMPQPKHTAPQQSQYRAPPSSECQTDYQSAIFIPSNAYEAVQQQWWAAHWA